MPGDADERVGSKGVLQPVTPAATRDNGLIARTGRALIAATLKAKS